jgi:hypothetical protein
MAASLVVVTNVFYSHVESHMALFFISPVKV